MHGEIHQINLTKIFSSLIKDEKHPVLSFALFFLHIIWLTDIKQHKKRGEVMPDDERVMPTHEKEDIPVYLTVVWLLGTIGVISVCGAIALAILGKPIPDSVVALGSASVGALAGLLAPSPGK